LEWAENGIMKKIGMSCIYALIKCEAVNGMMEKNGILVRNMLGNDF